MSGGSGMRAGELTRFTVLERVLHWAVAVAFVVLLLSGLALSYRALYWATVPLGGGARARALHPWVGALGVLALAAMFALWAKEMRLGKPDLEWMRAIRHYALHRTERVPPAGKYNAGQKLFFWSQAVLGAVFLLSGVILWLPEWFGAGPLAAMRLLHYVAAAGAVLLLIAHVYLSTLAHPGTVRGMLFGRVSRRWARFHHRLWSEEADR